MKRRSRRSFVVAVAGACSLLAGVSGAQISNLADNAIEACLNEGKIGKSAGKIQGVTRPRRLEIECSVDVDSAVFKVVDDHRRGLPAKVGGFQEMNFSDSYKYERAAYLLDRELGLNLVPVAVIREVKGSEGALVAWIPNTTHESRMTQIPTGLQLAELAQQKAFMRLKVIGGVLGRKISRVIILRSRSSFGMPSSTLSRPRRRMLRNKLTSGTCTCTPLF